jgi:hydrogenase nickel incorporation protein HypB
MHELGITRNIIAIVGDAAKGRRVARVTLEVGTLSGVLSAAIAFCFEAVAKGTQLDGATLEIREIEGRARYLDCGVEFAAPTLWSHPCMRLAANGAARRSRTENQDDGIGGGSLMCGQCGCGEAGLATILDLQTGQKTVLSTDPTEPMGHEQHVRKQAPGVAAPVDRHDGAMLDEAVPEGYHRHADGTVHRHGPQQGDRELHQRSNIVELEARILAKNDGLAARNRAWFAGREILALNLVSSPGAGKTTLLERTIRDLRSELPLFVIEGDQASANDGERIRAAGAPVVQVNTGAGCHLEADMIARGLDALKPIPGSVVMIENVGNLVCPALFDLGEWAKVVMLSVTEGEDKPLKYPHMFAAASLMVLNKIDLLPHLRFDVERVIRHARQVNPEITILRLSAESGDGLEGWYEWLRQHFHKARAATLL